MRGRAKKRTGGWPVDDAAKSEELIEETGEAAVASEEDLAVEQVHVPFEPVPQKYLHNVGIVVLITLLSTTAQFSTDLYMPALPTMMVDLNTTQAMTSLSMSTFMVAMAVGMLVISPVADKIGRKPVLLVSSFAAAVFAFICGIANDINLILVFRLLQGFAGGGMVGISTVLVKDCFTGKLMQTVLGVTQAISLIAPTIAPVLGVFVLDFAGWRGEFFALAILLALSFVLGLFMVETLPESERTPGGVFDSFKGVGRFVKSRKFMSAVCTYAFYSAGYMAYLGLASFIYINLFDVSEATFSMYYAITSLAPIAGSLLYVKYSDKASNRLISGLVLIGAICCVGLMFAGVRGPIPFLLCVIPYLAAACFMRSAIYALLLEDSDGNVGAASAVMHFFMTALGSIGMFMASAGWHNYVFGLSNIMVLTLVIAALAWFVGFLRAK